MKYYRPSGDTRVNHTAQPEGPLHQGWANFFVGGPNEKSKMSGGPTYFFTSHLSKQ
jgi:hypothetical protein